MNHYYNLDIWSGIIILLLKNFEEYFINLKEKTSFEATPQWGKFVNLGKVFYYDRDFIQFASFSYSSFRNIQMSFYIIEVEEWIIAFYLAVWLTTKKYLIYDGMGTERNAIFSYFV